MQPENNIDQAAQVMTPGGASPFVPAVATVIQAKSALIKVEIITTIISVLATVGYMSLFTYLDQAVFNDEKFGALGFLLITAPIAMVALFMVDCWIRYSALKRLNSGSKSSILIARFGILFAINNLLSVIAVPVILLLDGNFSLSLEGASLLAVLIVICLCSLTAAAAVSYFVTLALYKKMNKL